MSAGMRAIWFNKKHPDAVYLDHRSEIAPSDCNRRSSPDIVCDTRSMPSAVGAGYSLIVFDPPHVSLGASGTFGTRYGSYSVAEIRDIIKRSASEAHRVSLPDALMAFKWNDHDQKLKDILSLMEDWWEPLFGQQTARHKMSETYWVMLRRRPA